VAHSPWALAVTEGHVVQFVLVVGHPLLADLVCEAVVPGLDGFNAACGEVPIQTLAQVRERGRDDGFVEAVVPKNKVTWQSEDAGKASERNKEVLDGKHG